MTSYRALLAQARQIAGLIRGAGCDVPPRIGLAGGRSAGAYAAYLAVLRLGSTVVPISPAAPVERALSIARLGGLGLLLATSPCPVLRQRARERGITVLDVPELQPAAEPDVATTYDLAGPGAVRQPVAYILFTSGSTGRPKGVPISHHNALTFVAHIIGRYGLGPGCRMTQTFDLSFDVSVYDIFASLGSGATLVIPAADDLLHPVRWVNRQQITHWASVPSVISAARGLGELTPGSMPSLRLSLFIGEQLTLDQARAWQLAAPRGAVENFYGPTELTVAVSSYRLPGEVEHWPDTSNGTVPIGRVYDHLESVVVTTGGSPEEGELLVRGPQRCAGYLDPRDDVGRFAAVAGEAMEPFDGSRPLTPQDWYRTGDLVRCQRDGNLLHLGRLDAQVQIRGFRVELPEVEGALRLYHDVDDAVVLASPGALGSLELTAFYTGRGADARDIRAVLSQHLPAYMVPRRIVHLAAFPHTISGKIDRPALADSLLSRRPGKQSRPAPGASRQKGSRQ